MRARYEGTGMEPTSTQPRADRRSVHQGSARTTIGAARAPRTAEGMLALQRAAGNTAVSTALRQADEAAGEQVRTALGANGTPLDTRFRAGAESFFGTDLSHVRVHEGALAAQSASAVGARAYTSGSDIVFGAGQYDPSSERGKHRLAHELTHVVQQGQGPVSGTATAGGLRVSDPGDSFERHADATAAAFVTAARSTDATSSAQASAPVERRTRLSSTPVQRLFGKKKASKKEFKGEDYKVERTSEYRDVAAAFEKRLGVYAYKHARSAAAASASLNRMKGYLLQGAGSDNPMYKQAMAGAFGRADRTSAGQVGQVFASVDDIFTKGNLRERMTAFFNASSVSFKRLVTDMINSGSWTAGKSEGLDAKPLKKRKSYRDSLGRKLLGWGERRARGANRVFGKDLYAVDPLAMYKSGQGSSLTGATARQWQGKTSERTAGDLEQLGAGLSKRERKAAFGSKSKGETAGKALPWREGGTAWSIDDKHKWSKQIRGKLGMPVVAGPSGTTNFLFDAFKFLKLPGSVAPADFRLALLGWMMTSNDHSFHEIMSIAATKGLGLKYQPGPDAYHDIAPLSGRELRKNVADQGNFPDESVYHQMSTDGKFRTGAEEEPYSSLGSSAEEKKIKKAVGPGAAASVSAYTGESYLTQNIMMMKLPTWVKKLAIRYQIRNEAELEGLKKVSKKGKLSVTALMKEAKLHNRILHRALMDLPPWKGTTYRGTFSLFPARWRKGAKQSFATFTSTSKDKAEAEQFTRRPNRTLISFEVTDGRDIDMLSQAGGEDEILLPPGSKFEITEKPKKQGKYLTVSMRQVGGGAMVDSSPDSGGEEQAHDQSDADEHSDVDDQSEAGSSIAEPALDADAIYKAFLPIEGLGTLLDDAPDVYLSGLALDVADLDVLDEPTKTKILTMVGCDGPTLDAALTDKYGVDVKAFG